MKLINYFYFINGIDKNEKELKYILINFPLYIFLIWKMGILTIYMGIGPNPNPYPH
jgi:hypothetical protein